MYAICNLCKINENVFFKTISCLDECVNFLRALLMYVTEKTISNPNQCLFLATWIKLMFSFSSAKAKMLLQPQAHWSVTDTNCLVCHTTQFQALAESLSLLSEKENYRDPWRHDLLVLRRYLHISTVWLFIAFYFIYSNSSKGTNMLIHFLCTVLSLQNIEYSRFRSNQHVHLCSNDSKYNIL